MHLATAIEDAREMSDMIQGISNQRLAWLILRSDFKLLAEWEPRAVLLAEIIRRLAPEVLEWEETPHGWVTGNSVIDYDAEDILNNDKNEI